MKLGRSKMKIEMRAFEVRVCVGEEVVISQYISSLQLSVLKSKVAKSINVRHLLVPLICLRLFRLEAVPEPRCAK